MKKYLIIALAAAPLVATVPAFASDDDARCPDLPQNEWLGLGEVAAKLEGMGYQVREIERDRNCWEFEGTDANGAKVKGYLHPQTGDFIRQERQGRRS